MKVPLEGNDSIGKWVCYILTKDTVAFSSCSENLSKAESKSNELNCLAEGLMNSVETGGVIRMRKFFHRFVSFDIKLVALLGKLEAELRWRKWVTGAGLEA